MSTACEPEPINVKCIRKNRPCNKWFDQQVARRTNKLCEDLFGLGVTRRYVRYLNIRYMLWVESETGETIGSLLVGGEDMYYKVNAVAVSKDNQNRGVGSAMINAIDGALPKGATLWLCVDADREETDRLVDWYHRLGFQLAYSRVGFPSRSDEIVMTRVVV